MLKQIVESAGYIEEYKVSNDKKVITESDSKVLDKVKGMVLHSFNVSSDRTAIQLNFVNAEKSGKSVIVNLYSSKEIVID